MSVDWHSRNSPDGHQVKPSRTRVIIAAFTVLVLIGITVAYALTTFTVPSTFVNRQVATTVSSCGGTLTSPANITFNSPFIPYLCGSGPAFNVTTTGTDTATFTLPTTGYRALGYAQHGNCAAAQMFTPGTVYSLTVIASGYDLCGFITSGYSGPLASFSFAWNS